MYPSTPTTAAYLASRIGYHAEVLLWVKARNRVTNAVEALGLWTGAEDATFVIDGQSRTYIGAGTMISVEPIIYAVGLEVRIQRMRLSGIDATVEQLLRGYDTRLAKVELHVARFDLDTGALIDAPEVKLRGSVDEMPLHTPEQGGDAYIDMAVASQSRDLTRSLTLRKSDEAQRLRGGDRIRQYGDVTGKVQTYWGEGGPSGGYTISSNGRGGQAGLFAIIGGKF
jgi:hypothetical protein